MKFGVIGVDYKTKTRTLQASGTLYASMAKSKTITKEQPDKYLAKLEKT